MADFRRSLTALAVLALLLGVAVTASAQQPAFQCNASAAVPPQLRSEGLTELTGDIVLNCTGGVPTLNTANIPQANITVFLNTTVTSRLLSVGSEALLMIDEPNTAPNNFPLLPCVAGGSTAGCTFLGTSPTAGTIGPAVYSGVGGRANVFQGIVSSNSVTFLGVPIDPPGTNGSRVIRITNVRANANGIATGAAGVPGAVQASIAISGSTSIPINNPVQTVGFVLPGLTTTVRKPNGSDAASSSTILKQQCVTLDKSTAFAILEFAENFATAFKIRDVGNAGLGNVATSDTAPALPVAQDQPGKIYNAETGFYAPSLGTSGIGTAGLADAGTRLKAVFNNVPAGVTVYVTTANVTQTPLTLARLVGSESGFYVQVPSTTTVTALAPSNALCIGGTACTTQVAALNVVNGTATAVWEVVAADPLSTQTYQFGVSFGYTASPGTNSPAAGTATVNMSFAPIPPVFSASDGKSAQGAGFPIPRFVDLGTGSKNILNIALCRTNLLFPFTPNVAGFDTGIEISNTSADPFGTTPQAGTCTLNWFGATANGGPAPPATPVASIAAGATYANLVSTLAPGLNGYMIAVCNFQYAHGFAYIYNNGLQQAQGYLALIIPDPPRSAGVIAAGGEQLVN